MGFSVKLKQHVRAYLKAKKEKVLIPIIQPMDSAHILLGKTALITGGSSGIGFAIAKQFVSNGCKVVICGSSEYKLKSALNEIGKDSCKGLIIDIRDVKTLDKKVKEAATLFNNGQLDILVNCAGVAGKEKFGYVSEKEYDNIMDTNVKGTFFISQTVCNYMVEHGIKGHILNISSSSALRPAWTPYQISKWAISGFTKGLADSMISHGIIVNAIGPGQTATAMLGMDSKNSIYHSECPAGRYVTPEEVANLAVFMVSGLGDMVVGDTVYITGGSGTISMHR